MVYGAAALKRLTGAVGDVPERARWRLEEAFWVREELNRSGYRRVRREQRQRWRQFFTHEEREWRQRMRRGRRYIRGELRQKFREEIDPTKMKRGF